MCSTYRQAGSDKLPARQELSMYRPRHGTGVDREGGVRCVIP